MALQNTSSEKRIDKELKDIFMNAGKMGTSPEFTQNIMRLIEKESPVNQTVYSPLISTKGWMGVAVFILVIFIIAMIFGTDSTGKASGISQQIDHIFSLKGPVNILISAVSGFGEYLFSSRVFLSLTALFGLGVIFSFFYLKIESLRKNHIYS